MRIKKMIRQRANALIIYQILSTYFSRKCMVIILKNLYVDIGDLRVKIVL